MLCEVRGERRISLGEEPPSGSEGFESGRGGGADASAIVACSEEEIASPHEEQNLLQSGSSLKHEGQSMVWSSSTGRPILHLRWVCLGTVFVAFGKFGVAETDSVR